MPKPLVIAIDGPAGAGKSTVTRAVAKRLGILFLDTGAMYRAALLSCLESAIDLEDSKAIAAHVQKQHIRFSESGAVLLNGVDREKEIRSPAVTAEVWRVANNADCRPFLVAEQQAILGNTDAALEGRDATTVICPDALVKIYLWATAEERARRRLKQWQAGDDNAPSLEQIQEDIALRDHRDENREVGPLRKAEDALDLCTDGMAEEAVIVRILEEVATKAPWFNKV